MDVVGVGTATGRIIIHNIRLDETLMSFTQDWGPITSLSFRTGTRDDVMPVALAAIGSVSLHVFTVSLPLSVRRPSHCGVRQSSGPHCILGFRTSPARHSAQTCPQNVHRRGNVPARRADIGYQRRRQRHQGKKQNKRERFMKTL